MRLLQMLFTWLFLSCLCFSPLEAKSKKDKQKKHKQGQEDFSQPPQPTALDLEASLSPFILETKKITLPEYPLAFNPAITRWKDGYLLGCRIIKNQTKKGWHSYVGVIPLDKNFNPQGKVHLLDTRFMAPTETTNSADPRFMWIGEDLYVLYSDTLNVNGGPMTVRMWVGVLKEQNGSFVLSPLEQLTRILNAKMVSIEKNWAPFDYAGQLLLTYHLTPHRILRPFLDGTGRCESICSTQVMGVWKWGEYRAGSPAHKLPTGDYLAFFHSCSNIKSLQSAGKVSLHYVMGAYRFAAEPPFNITHMSSSPIVGKGFYKGKQYTPYWRPVQAVFPSGMLIEDDHVWLAYGRADHEMWIAKLDLKKLLDSLAPVTSVEQK